MKIKHIAYALKGFMDGYVTFSSVLQTLVDSTNWNSSNYARHLGTNSETFAKWMRGQDLPSQQKQRSCIESIIKLLDIDIDRLMRTLQKLEEHQQHPNNNTFVDAMQALDFSIFDKETMGKVMFGPHVRKKDAGTVVNRFKKRRHLPHIPRQKDFTKGAMTAIEVQILEPLGGAVIEKPPTEKPQVLSAARY